MVKRGLGQKNYCLSRRHGVVKDYNRNQRVSQQIQKEIAIIIQRAMSDPRIRMATVSGVKISNDLTYAKVFITFLNNNMPGEINLGIRILQDASGFIRSLLSKKICLRVVPKLTFVYDNSLVEGIRISNLVSQVVQNNY